jgi:adenine deaminase
LIKGGRVFVPGTREWAKTDLAVASGVIAGWGPRPAREVVDVDGASLTAGFIDAHMHLESTKLWVDEFVRTVLPHGTTAVAADPHELANVFGVEGVVALAHAAARLPFTFGVCASSCVPASPFESPGAEVGPGEVAQLIEEQGAIGVAEVMNFPGVINGDPELLAKIAAAGWRRVDGHAPGVLGRQLDAYLAAGVESDHECTELEEADEKRRKGMWIFIREGSASRNLSDLIATVVRHGTDRVALCTDDREPDTLVRRGHVNDCVRLAVAAGVKIEDALVLATSNPADYHHFDHLGWLAPGYQADVLCFEDLASLEPALVWQAGRLVAAGGRVTEGAVPGEEAPGWMMHSVHLGEPRPGPGSFEIAPPPGGRARVIHVKSRSLSTRGVVMDVTDGTLDVARIAVVERHRMTGRVGLGYVSGFGLRRGAIASSVAHDAHNIMVVGARDGSGPAAMAAGAARLAEIGGGQAVILDGHVVAEVPLPIGGLMSTKGATEVAEEVERLDAAARALGVTIDAPFMTLSFLGLSVIPELRITDRGLVDVTTFSLTEVGAV